MCRQNAVQSYDVVFRPYNAADLSKISGWDGSSDVIYSSVRVVVSGIEENESQEEEWSEENNGEASEDQNDSQWEEENSGTGENDSQESEDHSTGSTDEDAGVVLSQMDRKMTEQRRILSRTVMVILQTKATMNLAETARQRAASRMETAILQKRITARNRRIRMPVLRMKMPVTPMETVRQKRSHSRMETAILQKENLRIMPEIKRTCRKQGKNRSQL